MQETLTSCPKGYDKHSWKGPGVYEILGEKTIHPRNGNKPFNVTRMRRIGDIVETVDTWVGVYDVYQIKFTVTGKIDREGNQEQWLSNKTVFINEDSIRKQAEEEADRMFAPRCYSFFQPAKKEEQAHLRFFEYYKYEMCPTYKVIEGRFDRFGPSSGEDRVEIDGWEVKLSKKELDLAKETSLEFHLEQMEETETLIKGVKYTLHQEIVEENKAVRAKILESLKIQEEYRKERLAAREEFFKNPSQEFLDFVEKRIPELKEKLAKKAQKDLEEIPGEWV